MHGDITDRSVYAADIPEQVIDLPIGHDIPSGPASAVVLVGEPLGCEQLDIFLVDCHTFYPFWACVRGVGFMKRVSAQDLLSYAIFVLCLSVILFTRAEEWWEAPDWRPTSNDEEAFVQGRPGEHQFLTACRQGRVDVMEYWLSQKGFRPNDEFISGYTGKKVSGLRVASDCGHIDALKLLIKAGADLNQATDAGATPLSAASQEGLVEVVESLVKAGADLNQGTDDGAAPLFMASQNGHHKVVAILIQAGADLNQARNDGATPLYMASQNGHNKVVTILLKAGADLNQGTDDGASPLFIASQNGHVEVVEILAKAGADLNQTWNCATPLFQASHFGHVDVVEFLVKAGANLNQGPDDGATPLFEASQNGHVEIVEILIKAGADPLKQWHRNDLFYQSSLEAARLRKFFCLTNPETRKRYALIIKTLKPAVKSWKEQKKIQAQIDGNTGCFDGFVDALKHEIKHTVAPFMKRAPLKSKGY